MQQIESLALFPLSDVVLLPEISVPLYIFEPRYRQMVRDALASDHQVGMVTVQPDSVASMAGDPKIFDIGCLGRIAHAQERPDGTFQILLLGEHRFRILEELPRVGDRLYRSARVALIEDREPSTPSEQDRLETSRATVLELLARLVRQTSTSESLDSALHGFASLEPARLINALTQSVGFAPIERQQLLEADSILTRFEIMADLLRFRLAETGSMGSGSGSLPN